ncbi:MAG: oligosaccharide flippase family protein [Paludibacterium sp.]|uniref:lipopolysaccharide biosynthesis protein n=1 Tax=Paludibacterium sp. TaxID=1917523 RepID=UPI0025EF4786|nr:oligosaccharide flippase family protein [Paludibacterium sp.]MBV8045714.1 oligosaccharide flippase family protein [Paludibacterium sp.]MBV8467920.1 oligosaccharide flippase family protein [Burkholderiales bacterium]
MSALTRSARFGLWPRLRNLAARARSLLVYLSFSSASNAVGLLTTLFMIRHVMPQEFGRLAITLGALVVVNPVISFGADNLIAINKTKMPPEDYESFRRAYSNFALLIYVVAQALTLAVWLTTGWGDVLVLLVPLMAITKFFVNMASIEYVMEQRAVAYGLVQFLTTLVAAIVTIVLVLWVSPRAESRVAALMLADIALLVVRYGAKPAFLLSWRFESTTFVRIMKFGAPLMFSIAPAYLINEADKVVVARTLDLGAAGIYGAACTIAGFMLTFIMALLNATVPNIMAALKEGRETPPRTAMRYAMKFTGLTFAFAIVFLLAYTLAAKYLMPARYAAAIPVVYVLVGMMQMRSFYAVVGTITDYFGMTTEKLVGFVLGAAFSLGSMLLLVPRLGLFGAAFGIGMGYAALGGWLMLCLLRRQKSLHP